MTFNILNGDALAHSFPEAKIQGNVVVFREALIEGDLSGNNLSDLWRSRARHHEVLEENYYQHVVKEIEKIFTAPDNSEFNLWFEFDLFCQVNMWFVISVINGLAINKKVCAVYTSHLDKPVINSGTASDRQAHINLMSVLQIEPSWMKVI